MSNNVVPLMPIDTLHQIMAVNLNAAKSMETEKIVDLQLTDMGGNKGAKAAHYTLYVRKGILKVNPPSPGIGQFLITADSLTWKQLVLGKLDPQAAVASGAVVISGGTPASFYSFMDLFDAASSQSTVREGASDLSQDNLLYLPAVNSD